MPRPLRLYSPDLVYHVFARGNNRESIFFEENNYQRFLKNLERFRMPLKYNLYAFSLLPNHFHLLLQVGKVSISKVMQTLITAYTMYVNKKYQRVGHLFQGRFGSIIVEKETYLLQVLRYIHLNPVKAGIIDNIEDYPWSSYKQYLTFLNQSPKIEVEEVLAMFSQDASKQRKIFRRFTLDGLQDEFNPLKEQVRGVLGSFRFSLKLTKVLKGIRP